MFLLTHLLIERIKKMATKQLSYINGAFNTAALGTIINGDDSTALAAGDYIAETVLSSGSGLPSGITAKYIFTADGTATYTPATGESVYPWTLTKKCDTQSVNITFAKETFDSTTLCTQSLKTMGIGLVDTTISGEGVTTIGITDGSDGSWSYFIDKVAQAADGSETITLKSDEVAYLTVELNDTATAGVPYTSMIMPVYFSESGAGVAIGNLQTFTWGAVPAQSDIIEPQLFSRVIATTTTTTTTTGA